MDLDKDIMDRLRDFHAKTNTSPFSISPNSGVLANKTIMDNLLNQTLSRLVENATKRANNSSSSSNIKIADDISGTK